MSEPVLLYYNPSTENASKVRLSALSNGIRLREVMPNEYGIKLKTLCNTASDINSVFKGQPFSDEMLVMANFSEKQIDDFLKSLRSPRPATISLKAVMTSTNSSWTSYELYKQLSAEHEMFQKMAQQRAADKKI